jgi:hypothetical protein
VAVAGVTLAVAQQQPTLLMPERPANGASVGKKPKFIAKVGGADVEKLRFRIQLSTDGFKTIAVAFDQVADPAGWATTELDDGSPAIAYFAKVPVPGGDYLWKIASWDGLAWQDGGDQFRVQIDDVPPADVDGLRMTGDTGGTCVHLVWQAVTTDQQGRHERVARYHVYRYSAKGPTSPIMLYQAGETTGLAFDDCDATALKAPILYYRVVAEDEAGNIPGRRF